MTTMTRSTKSPRQSENLPPGVNIVNKINPWHIDDNGVTFLRNSGGEIALQYWLPEMNSVTTDMLERLESTYVTIMEGWGHSKGRLRFATLHRTARNTEIMAVQYPATNNPLQQALINAEAEANYERVMQGIYKTHNTYIIIHLPDFRRVERSDRRPWNESERREMMNLLYDERDRLISLLESAGITCSPVTENDAFDLQYSYYNAHVLGEETPEYDPVLRLPEGVTLEQVRRDESVRIKTLRSQIVQSNTTTDSREYLRNGDKYILVSDLKDYGDEGYPGLTDNFLSMLVNYNYWYFVDVSYNGEQGNIAVVERNVTAADQAAQDSGKRIDAVRAAKTQAETAQAYYQNGRFLRFGMSVVVITNSARQLHEIRSKIASFWQGAGRHIMTKGDFTNWDQFVYRLPPFSGMTTDFLHIQKTQAIAQFLPYYGPWQNIGGETLAIMENAYGTQQRLTLPKSSEQAAHMAFMGTTRSGKSFTLQALLMVFFMQGATLRITDLKDDYGPFVRYVGGQFIQCYPGGKLPDGRPVRFNIFQRREHLLSIKEVADIVAFMKALIKEPLNLELSALLQTAIMTYIESRTDPVQGRFEGGTLGGFVKFLFTTRRIGEIGFTDDSPQGRAVKAFATSLQLFTTGNYGLLFDGEGTVDLNNRVIVFDISQATADDRVLAAMMTLIRSNVNNAARNRKDKRSRVIFVNEETGVTGQIPEVQDAINEMVQAGAAYNLLAIIVAQNATSIRALDKVLNNVSRIIMGRLESRDEIDLLGDLLRLNEEQKTAISRLRRVNGEYNELFVRESKPDGIPQYGVVRFRPTDVQYCLFDSSPEAKTRRDELYETYGQDYEKQLAILVQERRQAQGRF